MFKKIYINIKEIRHYPILILASAVMMAKSLIYAHGLSVSAYGVLSKIIFWASIAMLFYGIGLPSFAQKKFPEQYDKSYSFLIANTMSLFYLLSISIAVISQLVIFVLCYLRILDLSFLLLPLYAISQLYFFLHVNLIRAQKQYTSFSNILMLRALLVVLMIFFFVRYIKLVPILIVIEIIINFIFSVRGLRISLFYQMIRNVYLKIYRLGFNQRYKKILVSSCLLGMTNVILTCYFAADNILATLLLSNVLYADYALAVIFFSVLTTIQSVINSNVYTNLGILVGKGLYKEALNTVNKITVVILILFAIFFFPAFLVIKFSILHFLPKYTGSIPIVAILLVSGFFRVADFYTSFLILCDKEKLLILFVLSLAVVALVSVLTLYIFGLSFTPYFFSYLSLALSLSLFVACCITSNLFCRITKYKVAKL